MTITVGIASADWVSPERSHTGEEIWGGSGWARLGQYIDLLPFKVVFGILIWHMDHFRIKAMDESEHIVDIIYMQRLMHEGIAQNLRTGRQNGQIIINDLDDWYWGLDPSNMAFQANHPKNSPGENINHYKAVLNRSDLVTVSTPYLADRITKFVRCPIEVIPNYIDVDRFTPRQHVDDGPPTIGWVGSTAHRSGDLETLKGIITPMVQSGNYKFHHSGHADHFPTLASKLGLRDSEVTTLPLARHDMYPNLMVMDIGLVPLRVTPFNRAKSYIKGLEYAASGIPFVAQEIDSYNQLYNEYGIGRVAARAGDWIRNIKQLSSAAVRQEEADRQRELVRQFDIAHGVARLTDVINSVIK